MEKSMSEVSEKLGVSLPILTTLFGKSKLVYLSPQEELLLGENQIVMAYILKIIMDTNTYPAGLREVLPRLEERLDEVKKIYILVKTDKSVSVLVQAYKDDEERFNTLLSPPNFICTSIDVHTIRELCLELLK